MERVLHICHSREDAKVGYAAYMLKDDALVWWNNLHSAIGSEGIAALTWEEFVTRLKAKFCSSKHQERLVNDFFALRKGSMSIDEYTKKFNDTLPFLGDTLPNEKGRVNRYLCGLPSDYSLEVSKASTLDEAIEAASRVEDMLLKKARERQSGIKRGIENEKRKFEGASGVNKRGRLSSNHTKKDEFNNCKKCRKRHAGECKAGSFECFKCGHLGHKFIDCRLRDPKDVECFSCHEKGHYSAQCSMKGSVPMVPNDNKGASGAPVKGRGLVMAEKEARETHDLMAGT